MLATDNIQGMNTNAAKIIDALGGTAEVARLFGVRMPSVSRWRMAGIPPARMMFLKAVHSAALEGIDLNAATAVAANDPHVAQAEGQGVAAQPQATVEVGHV